MVWFGLLLLLFKNQSNAIIILLCVCAILKTFSHAIFSSLSYVWEIAVVLCYLQLSFMPGLCVFHVRVRQMMYSLECLLLYCMIFDILNNTRCFLLCFYFPECSNALVAKCCFYVDFSLMFQRANNNINHGTTTTTIFITTYFYYNNLNSTL